MREVNPFLLGDEGHEIAFDNFRVFALGQSEQAADAFDVCIDHDAGSEFSYQICHVDGDRNHLVLLYEYNSTENVKSFIASDALRDAMNGAGVQGEPAIFVVNAGDSGKP